MYKKSLIAISALAMLSSSSLADTKNLSDIVVTSKSNKSIDDISSTSIIVSSEEINKINPENLKDILVRQAGIIESPNEASLSGRTGVSIRGLASEYSVILVDGKKVNPTDRYIGHSDFRFNWVPISMIERIEIIKGPKSSIYGSEAIGGVINIITKKDLRKIFGDISIQAGNSSSKNGGNEYKASVNIGGNISDKLSIFIGGNKSKKEATGERKKFVDFFDGLTKEDELTYIEGVDSTSGLLKLKFNIDDTQNIYASYLRGEEDRVEYKNKKVSYQLKRNIYSFGYEKNFEDLSLNLDYSKANIDAKADSLFARYTHIVSNSSIKGEIKATALKNNYIVLGAEASQEDYDRERHNGRKMYDFKGKTKSYYIQDELELGNFILSFGGRYDDNNKHGSAFSPNLGLVYKIDDKQRLKISYGEGFRIPELTRGSTGFGNGTHLPLGNDNLKSEESKSYELAYEVYAKKITFKTSLFKNDIKDAVSTKRREDGKFEYTNVAKVGSKGLELDFKYNFLDNHSLKTTYAYIKTENKRTNKELTYKPKHTFSLGLSSNFSKGFSSYLGARYLGRQYWDSENKHGIGGYTVFNAQISKDFTENLSINVGVNNIGNKKFKDGDPYWLKERLIYAGLKYKF